MSDPAPVSWGFSLFCDDIRAELGGKLSIMGIYQTDMVFPQSTEFPFVYPKFCILLKYYEAKGAFKGDIAIRIFFPGDAKDTPSFVLPFPSPTRDVDAPYPLEEDQQRVFSLTFPLTMSPFLIKQEGFVKVRAVTDGKTTNLGSLMIRKARPDEQNLIPGFPPPPPRQTGPTP